MKKKSICEERNFETIFEKHSESLRNFLYYKNRDLNLAEDIVQNSFIKLWKNCSKVIFEKARSYLYTIANNELLNHIAHQKVVQKHQLQPHSELNLQDPEFLIEEQEFSEKLQKALNELPEKQRETFLLSRIDKKSYKEISEITGVTIKATEKRIHNALASLREKLGDIL